MGFGPFFIRIDHKTMPRPDTPINQTLDTAVARFRAGDLVQAEALCAQALQAKPGHARALLLAGAIARQSGRLDAALDFLTRANRAEPHNPFILRDLAEVTRQTGDPAAAIPLLEQALARAPD